MQYFKYSLNETPKHYVYTLIDDELDSYDFEDYCYLKIDTTDKKLEDWKNNQSKDLKLVDIKESEYKDNLIKTQKGKNINELIKKQKNIAINSQAMKYKKNTYELNTESLNKINNIITLANMKYNTQIIEGEDIEEASKVYNEKIKWKTKENIFVELTIKELASLLEEGLKKTQENYEKYIF